MAAPVCEPEKYDGFLLEVLHKANATRTQKVALELEVMRGLPSTILPDDQEDEVRVGWQSTIRIKDGLLGALAPDRNQGAHRVSETGSKSTAGAVRLTLPRRHGGAGTVIDFRHVIADLVRKPGAFAGWRYRESSSPASSSAKSLIARWPSWANTEENATTCTCSNSRPTTVERVEEALEQISARGAHLTLDTIRRALPGADLSR